MAILKKIKASTLMETLVASVIIVIIFMLASMILNNIFSNSIKNNTKAIETHLNELQYFQLNNQLRLPYSETFKKWDITIVMYLENESPIIEYQAIDKENKRTISFKEHGKQ